MTTTISTMNSEAIALLRGGKNREAVCLLVTAAMRSLSPRLELEQDDMTTSSVLSDEVRCDDSISCNVGVFDSVEIPSFHVFSENTSEDPKFEPEIARTTESKNDSFFFPRAFEILHEKDSDNDSRNNFASISTIILFNIALACHGQGIQTGDSRAYIKALAVYSKAYTVIEKQDLSSSDPLVVVMLSILTNIIHIHSILHNIDELHAAMRMFCRVYEWARHHCRMKREDQQFFASRALFCACQRTTVAAAA